jgi:hypothetical protein
MSARCSTCQFPMWKDGARTKFREDGEPLFCCAPVVTDSSFCGDHKALVFVPKAAAQ